MWELIADLFPSEKPAGRPRTIALFIRNPKKNETAFVWPAFKAESLRWALDLVLRFPDSNRYPPLRSAVSFF